MAKCIYKSEGFCARSTSKNHCKEVTDAICNSCIMKQSTPTVSDKTRFQRIIRESISLLKKNDKNEAIRILKEALFI